MVCALMTGVQTCALPISKAQPSFGRQLAGIANALKRGDIALALGVTAILVVLILPLPAWLLDLSLAMSMTLSVLLLMTVIFITKPLDFNSFPKIGRASWRERVCQYV